MAVATAVTDLAPALWRDLPDVQLGQAADADRVAIEQSLSQYIAWSWSIIEPDRPYRRNWHIDLAAEYLEAVSRGQIRRLIINWPPRHMKSILVSVDWPTWEWTTRPGSRWLFLSYSSSLSTKHSLDRRAIIESDAYQARWGDRVHLSADQNQKTEFQNTRRGVMVASSFGGTATGKGGDRMIIDDPMNPEEAYSEAERQSTLRFYDTTLGSRLDDPEEGAIVLIMQRLHEKDLTGHLLELGFEHLVIPTEEDQPRRVYECPHTPPDASGRVRKQRDKGDLLWPKRFGPAAVAEAKLTLGPVYFAAQHQQRPAPIEGAIIKDWWWRFYDPRLIPLVRELARRPVQFWDTAHKKGQLNDYSVGATWAKLPPVDHPDLAPGYYLLDLWREKAEFPELKRQAAALRRAWRPRKIVIEDASSGTALAQSLLADGLPVELFPPYRDKIARAHAVSGYLEAGLCHLPLAAEWAGPVIAALQAADIDKAIAALPAHVRWVAEFLREHRDFPTGDHDDQVDTTTMMLLWYEVAPPDDEVVPAVRLGKSKARGW